MSYRSPRSPGFRRSSTSRELDAPLALVYRAFTEPDLLAQWLGPRKYTMTVERYDLRDGGTWRYLHADDAGNAYGFHGVFHGEPSPDGIVQTFEFEGAPGHVSDGHGHGSKSATARPRSAPTRCSSRSRRATRWSTRGWRPA